MCIFTTLRPFANESGQFFQLGKKNAMTVAQAVIVTEQACNAYMYGLSWRISWIDNAKQKAIEQDGKCERQVHSCVNGTTAVLPIPLFAIRLQVKLAHVGDDGVLAVRPIGRSVNQPSYATNIGFRVQQRPCDGRLSSLQTLAQ